MKRLLVLLVLGLAMLPHHAVAAGLTPEDRAAIVALFTPQEAAALHISEMDDAALEAIALAWNRQQTKIEQMQRDMESVCTTLKMENRAFALALPGAYSSDAASAYRTIRAAHQQLAASIIASGAIWIP